MRDWMEEALALAARAGEAGEVPVAALVEVGGAAAAAEANRVERDGDPTAHAEMLALRAAARALGRRRLEGATLWSTLEPCAMCAEAISQARVRRLVFGAWDARGGAVWHGPRLYGAPGARWRPEVIGGVRAEESRALMRGFFLRLRAGAGPGGGAAGG